MQSPSHTAPTISPDRLLRVFRGRLRRETRQGHILLCMALWSIISFLLISHFLFCSVTVRGRSMEPTLFPGEQFILNRWAYRLFPLNRGDLVVVRDPENRELLVKRIIAIPRDTIQLRRRGVYVNNLPLREDYLPRNADTYWQRYGEHALTLNDHEYFVMGDNRLISLDSRWYGPVHSRDILGTLSR